MDKYKNLLTQTTLIPLWAKAFESTTKDPILQDRHALEVLRHLGYDLDYYDRRKQNPSQVGCCLRAKWIDDETLRFVEQNGPCQVIQLGAGLDDRFRRINMPENVRFWYDLDLNEVMEMRRDTIPQVERNVYLNMNMFETRWLNMMKANDLPVLVIIEGVMEYLEEGLIRSLFQNIHNYLGGATVLFDSLPAFAVGKAKYHDSVKKYSKDVEYTWGLKEGSDIEKMAPYIHLDECVRMSDLPMAYKFRLILRLMYKIPFFYKNANQLLVKISIASPDVTG